MLLRNTSSNGKNMDICCELFNIKRTSFKKFLKENNLKKSDIETSEVIQQYLKDTGKTISKINTLYHNRTKEEREEINKKRAEALKKTLIEKYGVDNPMKIKEIREKASQTNLERYGVKSPIQNKEIKEKIEQTNLERYGAKCIFGNKEIHAQGRKVCKEKYGDEHPIRMEAQKQKRKKTNLKKYGTEEITQSEYFLNTMKKYYQELKGVDSVNESPYTKQIFFDRETFKKYISETFGEDAKPTVNDLMKELSVGDSYILKHVSLIGADDLIYKKPTRSSYEKELEEFIRESLNESNILIKDKKVLEGFEIDILLPDKKIAIEVNGAYWHSSLYKEKDYHLKKSKECFEKGYHLIHIYDYEWLDDTKREILKSILSLKCGKIERKISARKCKVKEISKKEASDFLNENHLQGYRNARINYGLFYEDELVQVMSFSSHSSYQWEIIRSCTKKNLMVTGGLNKLFNYFIKINNPNMVFSYCDFNKYNGIGYEKLDMDFIGYTTPDMKWVINGEVFNRQPSRHSEMKEKASYQIFGAGSKKYLWKKGE